MYGGIGSISGIVHVFARRPVLAATVVLAVVAVAHVPPVAPPPSAPPTPAYVTVLAPAPEPTDPGATTDPGPKVEFYSCVFGKASAPTNICKATLDDIALFLKNDPTGSIAVTGSLDRVLAVRKYFVAGESKFGIDPRRIEIHVESTDTKDNTVAITQKP